MNIEKSEKNGNGVPGWKKVEGKNHGLFFNCVLCFIFQIVNDSLQCNYSSVRYVKLSSSLSNVFNQHINILLGIRTALP